LTGVVVSLEIKLRRAVLYASTCEDFDRVPLVDFPSFAKKAFESGCSVSGVVVGQNIKGRVLRTNAEAGEGEAVIDYLPKRGTTCDLIQVLFAIICGNGRVVAESLFANRPTAGGRYLDYYAAHSWDIGRSDPAPVPLKKEVVAIPASGCNDTSVAFAVEHFDEFMRVLSSKLASVSAQVSFLFYVRYVPKSGGGIISCNAEYDCISFDFVRLGSSVNEEFMSGLFDSLYSAGIKCMPHVGKSVVKHRLFSETLKAAQRDRFVRVRQHYDPTKIFDGGQLKAHEIFSFEPLETA